MFVCFAKWASFLCISNSRVTNQVMTATICGTNLVVPKVYAPDWIAQYEDTFQLKGENNLVVGSEKLKQTM